MNQTVKEVIINFKVGFPIFLDLAKYSIKVLVLAAAGILAAFGLVYIFVELVWWAIITFIILTIILAPYFIGRDKRRWER